MDELRWILLLAGLGLVGGIYYIGRRRDPGRQSLLDAAHDVERGAGRRGARDDAPRDDHGQMDDISDQLDQLNELLGDAAGARANSRPGPERRLHEDGAPGSGRVRDAASEQKIIALHVTAARSETFSGAELQRVFDARGYEFGEYDIYHSVHEDSTVFSIVNMVKPGWFDPESMDSFTTPGISLFLQLPGPLAAGVAFDILVAEANVLARELRGTVQDASRSTLTQQTVQHLREEVLAFARQQHAR